MSSSRASNSRKTVVKLDYKQVVHEFSTCVREWEESDNNAKLDKMFGGISEKVELDRGVFLSLARFSERITNPGGDKAINPSMHQLVFLYKVLPMVSKTPLKAIYFQDPLFDEVEMRFLRSLKFPNVNQVVVLEGPEAEPLMTVNTFFVALHVDMRVVDYHISGIYPGLYISRKGDELFELAFVEGSETIEMEGFGDADWASGRAHEIRYLKDQSNWERLNVEQYL